MTKEELIELFDRFINEYGLWTTFKDFMESNGYSEEEYNDTMEDLM